MFCVNFEPHNCDQKMRVKRQRRENVPSTKILVVPVNEIQIKPTNQGVHTFCFIDLN